MKGLFVVTLLFLTVTVFFQIELYANSRDYYVSSEAISNDDNSGLTENSPLRTFANINSETLQDGDRIFIKRGSIIRDELQISGSGIIITDYGDTNDLMPIISGADKIPAKSFASHEGNILKTSFQKKPYFVYVDNERSHLARSDDYGEGLTFQNFTGIDRTSASYIKDPELNYDLLIYDDISNIYLSVEVDQWTFKTAKLVTIDTINSANSLFFNQTFEFEDKANDYFLSNHYNFLDEEGEFYFEDTSNVLYLYHDAPVIFEIIEATTRLNGIRLMDDNQNNITISNIKIEKTAGSGVWLSDNSHEITISNCNFFEVSHGIITRSGGFSNKVSNISVLNNEFENSHRTAIFLTYGSDLTILNNNIINTATVINEAEWIADKNWGNTNNLFAPIASGTIRVNEGQRSLIQYNRINNSGHYGITASNRCIILNNIVRNTCINFVDCGGVNTVYTDSVLIKDNIIENCHEGSIYIDYLRKRYEGNALNPDFYEDIIIDGNTVYNSSRGIANNSRISQQKKRMEPQVDYLNNTFYNIDKNMFSRRVGGGAVDFEAVNNNGGPTILNKNVFVDFSRTDEGEEGYILNWRNENSYTLPFIDLIISQAADFEANNNYYISPFRFNEDICKITYRANGGVLFPKVTTLYSFDDWKEDIDTLGRESICYYGEDTVSNVKQFFPIFVNETKSSKNWPLNQDFCWFTLDGQEILTDFLPISLAPFKSQVLVMKDCNDIISSDNVLEQIIFNAYPNPIAAGKTFNIEMDADLINAIYLYDALGKRYGNLELEEGKVRLPENLNAGTYFLNLIGEKFKETIQLVIQ